jgi:AcrR family transcriptional regulator
MTRTKPAEQRRADMLGAAEALFLAKGIVATSLEDITHAAGVSKGLFYLYFASKDDLVLALREQFSRQFAERIRDRRGHSTGLATPDRPTIACTNPRTRWSPRSSARDGRRRLRRGRCRGERGVVLREPARLRSGFPRPGRRPPDPGGQAALQARRRRHREMMNVPSATRPDKLPNNREKARGTRIPDGKDLRSLPICFRTRDNRATDRND